MLRKILTESTGKDWSLKANTSFEIPASETKLDYGLRFYTVTTPNISTVGDTTSITENYSWAYEITE